MKIAVFGLGYVGFTAACCLASQGHHVTGVDIDAGKVADITDGRPPFAEPGIAPMLAEQRRAGRLTATLSVEQALADAALAIVCVGTPSGPDGAHDMRHVIDVTRQITQGVATRPPQGRLVVAYRSTLRPGTMRKLVTPVFAAMLGADWGRIVSLVYHPEFLREAQAVEDFFHPPKVVIGTETGKPDPVIAALHQGTNAPVFTTRFEEAELTKFVDNAWHAAKVTFGNEIGRLCQRLGLSATQVHDIFVADTKLNISARYLRPGGAFGGSCLPKDLRALQHLAADSGAQAHLIDSLLRSNDAHKNHQFDHVARDLPQGARVLVAGLAFKAGTDDLRESPNVDLTRKLIETGCAVSVYDPHLVPSRLRGRNLGYAYSHLPSIDSLLVDRATAEAGPWDAVVATNATARDLDLTAFRVIGTECIA